MATGVGRHAVGGPERPVVVLDGRGDGRLFAGLGGVVAAHQALQLRELADHLGDEVRLGEFGGAFGVVGIGRRRSGAISRASRMMRLTRWPCVPSLLVEDDAVELGQPVLEFRLEVGLPEIAGVGKAGADDPLVAGDDRLAAIGRLDIGGEDEAIGETPSRRLDAPGDDVIGGQGATSTKHFWLARMVVRITSERNLEERLVEAADQHHRPLDQTGHFLEKRLVLDQFQTERERPVAGVGEDDLLAAIGVEDDLRLLELRHVVVEAAHRRSHPAP